MNILILNKWFIIGGIERVLISYIKIFQKLGYKITILSTYDISYLKQGHYDIKNFNDANTKFKYILPQKKTQSFLDKKSSRKKSLFHKILYEIYKIKTKMSIKNNILEHTNSKKHFDIIIDFNDSIDHFPHIKRYINTPIIKWVHSNIDRNKTRKTRKIYRNCDYIISINQEMKYNIQSLLNIEKNKLLCLSNPVDINSMQLESLHSIDITLKNNYFLVVSRLVKGKGLLELIDIYSELKNRGITNNLYIIGDGELKTAIIEKINTLGLQDNCHLLGEIRNPYPYFKHSKLFLFTSESEGLGMVLLESMALGIPVIAMDCPTGPKEILGSNSEYGKLIPLHNTSLFCDAVIELLENKTLWHHYSQQGLLRSKDFSTEVISQKIDLIFSNIIK